MCKQCQMEKITKYSFKRKKYPSDDILELVHTDLCGPIIVQCYYGSKYFILFVDDFSRLIIVMFLKEKHDDFKMFKWYLDSVEKEIGKNLKCLRFDREGEFISEEFNTFCNKKRIKK